MFLVYPWASSPNPNPNPNLDVPMGIESTAAPLDMNLFNIYKPV